MWFDQKDQDQDQYDSAGFADLITHAQIMAWLCLFAFVGFAAWAVL